MRTMVLLLIVGALAFADGGGRDKQDGRKSSMGSLAAEKIAKLAGRLPAVSARCFNVPDCDDEDLVAGSTQSETTIAVDSTGQHVVVGFNDFRGFTATTVSVSGFMYSDNGGATFVDGGQLPTGPTTVLFDQQFPQVFGDPDVKYLGACTFVYSSILLKQFGANGLVQTLSVHRSTDCGHTWAGPFEVKPASNPNGLIDSSGFAVDASDKELGDVDPDSHRYALCWSNFTPVALGGVEISCTYSDNLTSAHPTFSPRRVVGATVADGTGASVRFAGNGSRNTYVAWSRFPIGPLGFYGNNIGFARSTDNGVTWSPPVSLTNDFVTMDLPLGNDRNNNFPSMAVDQSPGAHRGNIYVVYSNNNSLDGADVVLQRSTDRGLTFSAPVLLNARPGHDRSQWFPYVTADRNTGRVWVYYYDQGVATSGDLTEISYLYSDDGGVNWSRPAPLIDRPFKAGWGNDTSQPNLGDYIQAVAQGGTFYAAFASTRQVGFTDGQPSTQMTTPDVNFVKVSSATVKAPLSTGAVSIEGSGDNGSIGPGDLLRLKIELGNPVTNQLSALTVRGIFAVLTTATPGVTVTQSASSYPDLDPGVTGENPSGFTLQVGSSFVPGTPIELRLAVGSQQGTAALDVTLSTGAPVYTTLLSENFDAVAPGVLPAGWTAAHGAGDNVVPWTTTRSFAPSRCGNSNKAFHVDAIDGPTGGSPSRWERLFSPTFAVPANAQTVAVDFDVCYDTEDDPVLPGTAYDGVFLRVTDLTPGRTVRSVLAEAFERRFTTGSFEHYPKHLPRNSDPNYFEDMSAWAGFSSGQQHVHLEFPGMAGSRAQLRFEYTQDQFGTCADVRPGHTCGVTVDNVVVRSVVNEAPHNQDHE